LISSAGNEKERISIQDVKEAVKSVTEDDTRSKNLMIFGLKEEQELEISLNEVLMQIGEKPVVHHYERLGKIATGSNPKPRPVKLTLASTHSVEAVLRRSHLLQKDIRYKSVYVAPDRSLEKREQHRDLVKTLKVRIAEEPQFYHFIKDCQIYKVPKRTHLNGRKQEVLPLPPR
jgi:uncharacterized OsmC-like protein